MKKLYIIFILLVLFTNCQNKNNETNFVRREFSSDSLKNYNLKLLSTNYEFDLTNRNFKLNFYKYSDTIKLSKVEENKISKIFFENFIDTLYGDYVVSDSDEEIVMPNFGYSFYIYKKGTKKSFFRIIDGKYESLENLSQKEKNLLIFRNKLLSILKKNIDFKKCMDTLKAVKKYDKRVFL